MRANLGKVNKEDFEKEVEKYFEEKSLGFEIVQKAKVFEGLIKSVLNPEYEKVLSILPLISRLENKGVWGEDKQKEVTEKDAIEFVLAKEPENEVQKLIREDFMKRIGNTTKVEVEGMEGSEESLFNKKLGVQSDGVKYVTAKKVLRKKNIISKSRRGGVE